MVKKVDKKELVFYGVKIPKQLDVEIRRTVSQGTYLNKSDFVRIALRSELLKVNQNG
ncbi:MAG: ribbon-helix-helix domain-containing protein [Candidatus Hodarchaeales archaeon]